MRRFNSSFGWPAQRLRLSPNGASPRCAPITTCQSAVAQAACAIQIRCVCKLFADLSPLSFSKCMRAQVTPAAAGTGEGSTHPPGPRQYRRNSGPAATVRSPGAGRKCPSGLASDVVSALQAAVARMLRRFGVSIGVLEAWMQDKVSHFDAKPRRRAAIQLQHRELRVRRSDDVLGQRGSPRGNVVDFSEAIHEQEIQGYVGILHPHGYPLALGK